MIEFSFCVPTAYLDDFDSLQDFHLLLAHLVEPSNAYTKFYSQNSKWKVLDNGAVECGVAMEAEKMCEKIELTQPNEVVLPDIWKDAQKTIRTADRSIKLFRDAFGPDIKFMGVVQGLELESLVQSFNWFNQHPEIYSIGFGYRGLLPALFSTHPGINRLRFLSYLLSKLTINKVIHLLGMPSDGGLELMGYRHAGLYLRLDTGDPTKLALAGKEISQFGTFEKPSPFDLDFSIKVGPKVLLQIWNNCMKLRAFASEVYVR